MLPVVPRFLINSCFLIDYGAKIYRSRSKEKCVHMPSCGLQRKEKYAVVRAQVQAFLHRYLCMNWCFLYMELRPNWLAMVRGYENKFWTEVYMEQTSTIFSWPNLMCIAETWQQVVFKLLLNVPLSMNTRGLNHIDVFIKCIYRRHIWS